MDSEKYLNNLLQSSDLLALNKVGDKGVHYLRLLCTDHTKDKDLISINYKTDLKSGIYLDPNFKLTNDGLLDYYTHLHNNKGVIHITYKYQYSQKDLENPNIPLSSKEVLKKIKLLEFFFEDGTLDTSDTDNGRFMEHRLTSKEKEKRYSNLIQKLELGAKRRKNIKSAASKVIGAALILLGICSNDEEAKNKMSIVTGSFNSEFNQYQEFGFGDIYESLSNDKNIDFLDAYFPTSNEINSMHLAGQITEIEKLQMLGAVQLYGMEDIQGRTIKNYLIEKLKGNLK